jgi:hypothetical protein
MHAASVDVVERYGAETAELLVNADACLQIIRTAQIRIDGVLGCNACRGSARGATSEIAGRAQSARRVVSLLNLVDAIELKILQRVRQSETVVEDAVAATYDGGGSTTLMGKTIRDRKTRGEVMTTGDIGLCF